MRHLYRSSCERVRLFQCFPGSEMTEYASNKNYDSVIATLNKGERLSERKASQVAFMYSSLRAELAIEFDSLSVTPTAGE
jgi:hypothetical protein